MKVIIVITISTVLLIGACSSGYYATAGRDDLYYTVNKNNTAPVQNTAQNQQVVRQTMLADNHGGMTDYEK